MGMRPLPLLLMVLVAVVGYGLSAAELQREQSKSTFFLHCWVPELGEPPVVEDDLRRTLHAAAQETIAGRLRSAEERMEPVMTQLASLRADDQVLVILFRNEMLQSALKFGKHGSLRAYEIFRDMPAAALITLSACETGAEPRGGRAVEKLGESNSLLSFAFAGGARFVLASVWNAQDPNAVEIMEEFYRGLIVEQWPKARALHAAKLRLRAGRLMHPFYFANFSLMARDLAAVAEE